MSSDCPQFGKWIGGCRFEPRYDEGAPDFKNMTDVSMSLSGLKAMRPSTYVKDVCIRCGKEIKR